MREIKFRFWSNHLGRFVIPDDSIFVGALKDPDMNPMQFTGLVDKNGVEIYEGDIVRWTLHRVTEEHIDEAVVYYDEQQAHFWMGKSLLNPKMGLVLNDWMRGEYEVIGNIYENPQLLATPTESSTNGGGDNEN